MEVEPGTLHFIFRSTSERREALSSTVNGQQHDAEKRNNAKESQD